MLEAFYNESVDCCGACDDTENMSYMNADDLVEVLGLNKQEIGGIMASLNSKGMIQDTMDSPRGSRITDWVITGNGVEALGHKWN